MSMNMCLCKVTFPFPPSWCTYLSANWLFGLIPGLHQGYNFITFYLCLLHSIYVFLLLFRVGFWFALLLLFLWRCRLAVKKRKPRRTPTSPSAPECFLSLHVSPGFDSLLCFDSHCLCGVVMCPDLGPFWFCFRRDNFRNVSNIKQVSTVSILVPFAPAPISLFLFELVLW